MSSDAVVYHYVNVGVPQAPVPDAGVYHYVNVVLKAPPHRIGRLYGYSGGQANGIVYHYANIETA